MKDEELSVEETVSLSNRLFRCANQHELARVLGSAQIEAALKGSPDCPSELLVLYTLHFERIRRKLGQLPDQDPSLEDVEKAATVLASEYLLRLEFLADYSVHPQGIAWTILARDTGLDWRSLRFGNS